jgi:hypothetical protein
MSHATQFAPLSPLHFSQPDNAICKNTSHDMSEVLRLPHKMKMDTSQVLGLPRKMQVIFWKRGAKVLCLSHKTILSRHFFSHENIRKRHACHAKPH